MKGTRGYRGEDTTVQTARGGIVANEDSRGRRKKRPQLVGQLRTDYWSQGTVVRPSA
jgi:hypothetical protein